MGKSVLKKEKYFRGTVTDFNPSDYTAPADGIAVIVTSSYNGSSYNWTVYDSTANKTMCTHAGSHTDNYCFPIVKGHTYNRDLYNVNLTTSTIYFFE